MKKKSIKIDLAPEQPIVYLVTAGWVSPEHIAEVYTNEHAALERASEMKGWVVRTINLEEE